VKISICFATSKKSSLKLTPTNKKALATTGMRNFLLRTKRMAIDFIQTV
jgi:hypothetical protein